MGQYNDLTGKVIGKYTVIELLTNKSGRYIWKVRCSCGQEREKTSSELNSGKSKSCGCDVNKTHGMTKSKEYSSWNSMRARVNNPKHDNYHIYGGAGIKIFPEWQSSFQAFIDHLGKMPGPGYTIDRIDSKGHYWPGNVKWSTKKEQGNNRRTNVNLTFNGETRTMMEWCEKLGLKFGRISDRIRAGWSPEDALTKPFRFQMFERKTAFFKGHKVNLGKKKPRKIKI